ncbi:MAG TPA: queuosine salvage family protein [Ktedonobacterales bacterium]|jgi:hypothetical protein|nr:queuosine salvage family protein [Ktedonobacterales bacterium]
MSVLPPELTESIVAPEGNRLGVLSGTVPVVREGTLVAVDGEAVEALAARWSGSSWPEVTADFSQLHFVDGTWRTANWMLFADALNFCFWALPGEPRWRVEWQGQIYDGYYALAAALTRAVAEGRPVWDAGYLANLDVDDLAGILRPIAGSPPIPLFEERLANAREVGWVLFERYGGRFTNAVAAAGRDAVELALLLAREFSSFADIAEWDDLPVSFLKRAQICVADLNVAFDGRDWGALDNLDRLTAFADYKLPQLLRAEGVLVYAPELAELVDSYTLLPPGSDAEVEIRAATVWSVELLRRALATRGIHRHASAIDYRIWAESQHVQSDVAPYHRTRTMYY